MSLLLDSNQRPRDYKSRALPAELKRRRNRTMMIIMNYLITFNYIIIRFLEIFPYTKQKVAYYVLPFYINAYIIFNSVAFMMS